MYLIVKGMVNSNVHSLFFPLVQFVWFLHVLAANIKWYMTSGSHTGVLMLSIPLNMHPIVGRFVLLSPYKSIAC